MTPPKPGATNVVVVDGSNIATEGRSLPSLSQLHDAVMAFIEEFPDATVTVVVDATFGHRIDKRESAEFDAAVANNELVAPPAGAIGRGDAFVLSIANKVGARILSNDSFQEFHGDYPWLFDEGRLIGGKPVPNVGWVFVERLPVKGPVSRKAQRAAKDTRSSSTASSGSRARRSASVEASQPMPVPTSPPPGPRRRQAAPVPAPAAATIDAASSSDGAAAHGPPSRTSTHTVNEVLPFLDFVEHHPLGSSVNGVVESYSSHGAYVTVGEVRGYVPLRLMADPPPRSAREVMKIGDAVTLVVTSFAPGRRSIDLAVPPMAPGVVEMAPVAQEELVEIVAAVAAEAPAKAARRTSAARTRAAATGAGETAAAKKSTAKKAAAPAKKPSAKKATADAEPAAKKTAAKKAPAAAKVAPPVEEVAATKRSAPAKRATATGDGVPVKKTAARKKKAAVAPSDSTEAPPAKKSASRRRSGLADPAPAESPAKTATSSTSRRRRTRSAAGDQPTVATMPEGVDSSSRGEASTSRGATNRRRATATAPAKAKAKAKAIAKAGDG